MGGAQTNDDKAPYPAHLYHSTIYTTQPFVYFVLLDWEQKIENLPKFFLTEYSAN